MVPGTAVLGIVIYSSISMRELPEIKLESRIFIILLKLCYSLLSNGDVVNAGILK